MKKILFVCLGNICRSPMAEFVLRDLAVKEDLQEELFIDSAGTIDIEVGRPVYPPVRELLAEHGIRCSGKQARMLKTEDYDNFDLIIAMDDKNVSDMLSFFGGDPKQKIHLLMEYTGEKRAVADPYFTRDFLRTWEDVAAGCEALMKTL